MHNPGRQRLETTRLLNYRHQRCVSWSSVFGERHSEAHARNEVGGMWEGDGGGDGTGPEQEEFFGEPLQTSPC